MTALAVFFINLFTSLMKRYVMPRFGATGVRVVVFLLAFGYSVYHFYGDKFPGVVAFTKATLLVFAFAITAYEAALQYIPFFKQKDATLG